MEGKNKKTANTKSGKIVRISENKLVSIIEQIVEGQKKEWLAEHKKNEGGVLAERLEKLEAILKNAKVIKKPVIKK